MEDEIIELTSDVYGELMNKNVSNIQNLKQEIKTRKSRISELISDLNDLKHEVKSLKNKIKIIKIHIKNEKYKLSKNNKDLKIAKSNICELTCGFSNDENITIDKKNLVCVKK